MVNDNLQQLMTTVFQQYFENTESRGSLGEFLYIKGRIGWKGLKKDEYLQSSGFRIINGESLTEKGIDWSKAGFISEERYMESPEIMLQEGDILLSKDGTIGKIGYVDKLDTPTTVTSGIFVIRNQRPDEVSTAFIFCLLTSHYFKEFIASRTEGSVIPHLYQKDFVTLTMPLLTKEETYEFDQQIQPVFDLLFATKQENLRLSTLRDALLPKLMNGEIDISAIRLGS